MMHILGFDRCQLSLFGSDNSDRFIDAFVDGLDLASVGFTRVTPKATGRPGYAPGDRTSIHVPHIPRKMPKMKSAHRSLTGTGVGTSPATTPKTTIAGLSLPTVDVRMCIRAGGAVFNGVVPYLEVRTGNQLVWIAVQFNSASGKTAQLIVC